MNIKRTNVFLALAMGSFLLAGCGGGGGGGTPAPAPSVTKETASLAMGEGELQPQALTGSVSKVEALIEGEGVSVTPQEGGVRVEVAELSNDTLARYRIAHGTASKPYETILTVNATNTSALPLLRHGDALVRRSLDAFVLADEVRLATIVLDLQYLAGEIAFEELEDAVAMIQAAVDAGVTATEEDKAALASTLSAYRQGTANELDLMASLEVADSALQALGDTGEVIIESLEPTLVALGVELPEGLASTYDPVQDRYTRFTDDALGAYADGQWTFSPEYDWLNVALRLSASGH